MAAGLEGADINAVAAKANEMWNDAYDNTPTDINASYQYTEGKLKGTVNPGILNANKQYLAGVQYTVTLNGPAVFDATGTNTYTGVTTAGQEEHIAWTATDDGDVQVTVSYPGLRCPAHGFRRPAAVQAKSRTPNTGTRPSSSRWRRPIPLM